MIQYSFLNCQYLFRIAKPWRLGLQFNFTNYSFFTLNLKNYKNTLFFTISRWLSKCQQSKKNDLCGGIHTARTHFKSDTARFQPQKHDTQLAFLYGSLMLLQIRQNLNKHEINVHEILTFLMSNNYVYYGNSTLSSEILIYYTQ